MIVCASDFRMIYTFGAGVYTTNRAVGVVSDVHKWGIICYERNG